MQKQTGKLIQALAIGMMISNVVSAGGFALYTESSVVAIGNYAAGIAAEAADASTGWYNPAGLVLIDKPQFIFAAVGALPSVLLTGNSVYETKPNLSYEQPFTNYQATPYAFIPSIHYAQPLGERATFGFSVVAPYGLATAYEADSPLRYSGTLTKLETFNFSPELGGRLTDHLSVGAGIDFQYATVKFNQIIGSPAFEDYIHQSPSALDSQSYNTGNSFNIGFHAGTMLMLNENHSRIGLNYQSEMRHQFNGESQLVGPLADPNLNIYAPNLANPNASFQSHTLSSNKLALPAVITLSGYQDINDAFALLGSVVYTGWGSFRAIDLNGVAVGVPTNSFSGGNTLTTTNSTNLQNFQNTWRFALGSNYIINPKWKLRMGGGYDKTPTTDAYRNIRLPDGNRWALSLGAHFQPTSSIGFDAGYTYLFACSIDTIDHPLQIDALSTTAINATNNGHAQIIGLQLVWSMDKPRTEITK